MRTIPFDVENKTVPVRAYALFSIGIIMDVKDKTLRPFFYG